MTRTRSATLIDKRVAPHDVASLPYTVEERRITPDETYLHGWRFKATEVKRGKVKTNCLHPPCSPDSGISMSPPLDDYNDQVSPAISRSKHDDHEATRELQPSQDEMDYLVMELALSGMSRTQFSPQQSAMIVGMPTGSCTPFGDKRSRPNSIARLHNDSAISLLSDTHWSSSCRTLSDVSLPGASLHNYTGLIRDFPGRSAAGGQNVSVTRLSSTTAIQKAVVPTLHLPPLFRSIALTDSNITGQPIRFCSSGFALGTNTLRVGSCTFLNLPYGSGFECGLRVEPGSCQHGTSELIILQVIQTVVDASTGRQLWLMCADLDITTAFTPAIKGDLAAVTRSSSKTLRPLHSEGLDVSLANRSSSIAGEVLLPATKHDPSATNDYQNIDEDEDIWLSLAATLEEEDILTMRSSGLAMSSPSHGAPSPRLKDLLNLFDEIRILHREFFVIRMRTRQCELRNARSPSDPENPRRRECAGPIRFSITSFSAALRERLLLSNNAGNDRHDRLAGFTEAMAIQLHSKISSVGVQEYGQGTSFWQEVVPPTTADGGHERRGVYGVPMYDSPFQNDSGKVDCWICFLVDPCLASVLS